LKIEVVMGMSQERRNEGMLVMVKVKVKID